MVPQNMRKQMLETLAAISEPIPGWEPGSIRKPGLGAKECEHAGDPSSGDTANTPRPVCATH